MDQSGTTAQLQHCLNRFRNGDASAREDLLRHSHDRLFHLTRRMLSRFPKVHRWEETDDVLQQALIRLDQTLGKLEIDTVRDYLRLAATTIRRLLIDYARHYGGPRGLGTNHATPLYQSDSGTPPGVDPPESQTLLGWSDFHARVNDLPDEELEVFELLWYHELTQQEAAEVLGISLSTLKRRWQSARLHLMESFGGESPF